MKNKIVLFILALLLLQGGAFAAWVDQTPPPGATYALFGVAVSDETTAYAVGATGKFVKTTDRGITWTASNIGGVTYTWRGIKRLSATSMRAVGAIATGYIFLSTNDGASWAEEYNSLNISDYKTIDMYDTTHGFAGGIRATGKSSNGSYYDSNALVWTDVLVGGSTSIQIYGVSCPSSTYFYAVGNFADDKTVTGIYRSTNSGKDWTILTSDNTQNLYGVYALSSSIVWVVGNAGTVLYTSNAGSSWTAKTNGITGSPNFKSIHFYDGNNGYIVGESGVIYVTSNGGEKWTLQTSGTSNTLNFIRAVDANNAWAVGSSATISKWVTNPTVTSFTFTGGGTTIQQGTSSTATLVGTNLQSGLTTGSINLGAAGLTISDFVRSSSTQATMKVAAAADATTGARNVIVTNPDTGSGTGTSLFSVTSSTPPVTPPTVSSIDFNGRSSRPLNWSGTTTIIGTNFHSSVNVVSDVPSSIPFVVSTVTPTSIVGTVTLGVASPHTFRVTNTDDGGTVVSSSFEVNQLPVISSFTPSTGTQGTTATYTITGNYFQDGITFAGSSTGVTFGTATVTGTQSATVSIVLDAAALTGNCTVTATNPDSGTSEKSGVFAVNSSSGVVPAINSISPTTGTQGATALTITVNGSNLPTTNGTIQFSGTGITPGTISYVSSSQLTVPIDIATDATIGMRNISVMDNTTGNTGSRSNAFTVQVSSTTEAAPTVTSVVPGTIYVSAESSSAAGAFAVGASSATDTISLMVNGTGFNAPTVSFSPDSLRVTATEVLSATQIRVTLQRPTTAAAISTYIVTVTNGSTGLSGSLAAALSVVAQSTDRVPRCLETPLPYPNPWRPLQDGDVTFQFRVNKDMPEAKIRVWSIDGRKQAELSVLNVVAGKYMKVRWNGDVYGSHKIANGLALLTIQDPRQGDAILGNGKIKLVVVR
ncbi:MAG: YCF48-related protein [Candidatus Margulisiibacteriota bacterium]